MRVAARSPRWPVHPRATCTVNACHVLSIFRAHLQALTLTTSPRFFAATVPSLVSTHESMGNQDTSIDLKADNDQTQDIARLSALNTALDQSNTALKDANLALRELVSSLQNERTLLLEKVEAFSKKAKKAPRRHTIQAGVVRITARSQSLL